MHMVIVRYDDDAERKKIEYLIAKYRVKRVKDVVIEVDDSIFSSFIKELLGRVPEEKIRLYEVSEKKVKIERSKKEITDTIDTDIDTVRQFIDYLMVRRRGNYRGKLRDFERYRIYTKKGFVDISIGYSEVAGKTGIHLIIEGSKEGVEKIHEEMRKEIENYNESVRKRR
jgi:hypothetical protein